MTLQMKNALLLTMENEGLPVSGELQVTGNRIRYAGDSAHAPDGPFDRVIDLKNNGLIIPGFKNAHTHSAMTFLRSFSDDLPLSDWLNHSIFPHEAKLCGDDIYWLSQLAFLEYCAGGITACFDMYLDNAMTARAASDFGFRTVLCGSINDFGGTAEDLEQDFDRYNDGNPFVSFQLGFHAEYTTSEPLLKSIASVAKKKHAPVYTHNSETAEEVTSCIGRHGASPMVYLDRLGLFAYGGGGFHCVHFSEEDLRLFADRQLFAVTCPASNAKLASGIAPLTEFDDAGIRWAIGTDGPASNNALDFFREMYLACVLQKLRRNDAAAADAARTFYAATVGGARAMGLNDCDTLCAGKKADFTVIDLSRPNMQPFHNLIKNVVYSGNPSDILLTVIDGKICYESGKFPTADTERIFSECRRITHRICGD